MQIISSLKGRSDDIVTGRFHQSGTVKESAEYFDIPEGELASPVDRTRLEAILALLVLWKQRHTTLLQEAAQKAFDLGRNKAIIAANLPSHQPIASAEVPPAFLARYESDVSRLAAELEAGTKRFEGVRSIIEKGVTLGEVALQLRRLEDVERFRLDLMSEHLVWWGESEGLMSGAKEATSLQLAILGYANVKELPKELLGRLPRYVWAGPDDSRCCGSCLAAFNEDPVFADQMISPAERCEFGANCRHFWSSAG